MYGVSLSLVTDLLVNTAQINYTEGSVLSDSIDGGVINARQGKASRRVNQFIVYE